MWPDLGTPESYNPNVLQDHNQPLTPTDLETLQGFLLSHGVIGSEQTIERASDECNGFGLFIRSLDGFDRNAPKERFAEFLNDGTHTATQTRFINEILGELTRRCEIDPACLYDPTFSDLAPTRPEDLFAEEEVDRICQLLYLIHTGVSASQAA